MFLVHSAALPFVMLFIAKQIWFKYEQKYRTMFTLLIFANKTTPFTITSLHDDTNNSIMWLFLLSASNYPWKSYWLGNDLTNIGGGKEEIHDRVNELRVVCSNPTRYRWKRNTDFLSRGHFLCNHCSPLRQDNVALQSTNLYQITTVHSIEAIMTCSNDLNNKKWVFIFGFCSFS